MDRSWSSQHVKRSSVCKCAVVCAFAVGCFLLWRYLPAIYLSAMTWTDEPDVRASIENRIRNCGRRSIPFVIKKIRDGGSWDKEYSGLPALLSSYGESGHQALEGAMSSESDPSRRSYLISALAVGFDDSHHLPEWVDLALSGRVSHRSITHLSLQLRETWPLSPPLLTEEGEGNPEFRIWWQSSKDKFAQPRKGSK